MHWCLHSGHPCWKLKACLMQLKLKGPCTKSFHHATVHELTCHLNWSAKRDEPHHVCMCEAGVVPFEAPFRSPNGFLWSPFRVPKGPLEPLSGPQRVPPTNPPHQLTYVLFVMKCNAGASSVQCRNPFLLSRSTSTVGSLSYPLRHWHNHFHIYKPLPMPHHLSVAHNPGTQLDLQDDYCQHCVNNRERSWTFIDACCVEQLRSLWLKTFQLALVPLDLGSSTCLACLLLGLLIVTMFQESFLPLPRIYLRVQ